MLVLFSVFGLVVYFLCTLKQVINSSVNVALINSERTADHNYRTLLV